jgi:hypothetical protein
MWKLLDSELGAWPGYAGRSSVASAIEDYTLLLAHNRGLQVRECTPTKLMCYLAAFTFDSYAQYCLQPRCEMSFAQRTSATLFQKANTTHQSASSDSMYT